LHLYLAPIRGITDCIFRTIFANHFHGFDAGLAPFISSVKGKTIKRSHIKDILPEHNRVLPIIPQIIGNNPDDFIALARSMFDLGYSKVNWNIGCPFPQVTKKKRGAGLLPHPEMIKSFLDQVVSKIPNSLSIKTRLGLISKDEMRELLTVFNQFQLAEIIMHPRTGYQLYTGEVDLEGFEQFERSSAHPVVYNGDIVDKESFCALQTRFPKMSQWMIGRGVIANPLLGEILRGETTNSAFIFPRIKSFHDDLLAAYAAIFDNSGNILDKMKGIWLYLSQSFPNGGIILRRVQKLKQLDQYKGLVEEIFIVR
jgi:tRNA-dihydrouridine synthase B